MPINTVPLGEAGTGAAYILPQGSEAAQRLLDTIDYNQKVGAYNQQQKLKKAQEMAQSYKDNAFKAKNGTLFNNELMALQAAHIKQGQDYAKQGFDIYNPNPNNKSQMDAHEQYMADRMKLYNMQDVRDQLAKHLADQDEILAKAKPGTYNPKSVQKLHDFYNSNTLQGIIDSGAQAPFIQEAFNPQDAIVSKLKPVMTPEREFIKDGIKHTVKQFMPVATGKNIENLFVNSPGGEDYVQEQTGLTPSQAKLIPDNLDAVTKLNDDTFRSTPQGRQALVNAGISDLNSPEYKQLLAQKSQQDFANKQKYNSFLKNYVDLAKANSSEIDKSLPDYTEENQRWNRESRAHERQGWEDKDKEGDIVFGNQESSVPVLKSTYVNGKVVPQTIGYNGKKPITANSYVEPEQGATLFSQSVPQVKMNVTPGTVITLKNGHAIKNTSPFEITAGSVKMEPVFQNLSKSDSRNGAVVSKRQLMEAIQGKNGYDLSHIAFNPLVYGTRPVKDVKGHTDYEPVAFPYDAIRGNPKIKTTKFEETEKQFHELLNSAEFRNLSDEQKLDFLSKQFNIK